MGIGVAYTVNYIARRGPGGRSILDELLDHPEEFAKLAKKQVLDDVAETVKEHLF